MLVLKTAFQWHRMCRALHPTSFSLNASCVRDLIPEMLRPATASDWMRTVMLGRLVTAIANS